MRSVRLKIWFLAALSIVGCAGRPINERISRVDPDSGYRPHLRITKRLNNDPHTLFVLSSSDGGTRAAAFSIGVAEAQASAPKVDLHVLDVSFGGIRDDTERAYFMNLPTSFTLPAEGVDRLREVAGRLLRESMEYKSLLRLAHDFDRGLVK